MASFNIALGLTLAHEGGYVDDPNDPGGETNYGISKRQFPDLDIKSLTPSQVRDIYRQHYWSPVKGNRITSQHAANVLFDAAVNTGVSRAVRQVQRLAGVTVDGKMGPKTLEAVNADVCFSLRLTLERIKFYTNLVKVDSGKRRYLVGWVTRALSYQ